MSLLICNYCGAEFNSSGFGCPCISRMPPITKAEVQAVLKDETVGQKFDSSKTPFELLSPAALLGTAEVLKFGAKKYAPNNWRKGLAWTRIIGAIGRHLLAFMAGEDLDPETQLPHVDHLACEIMFLQEFYKTRKDLDDRSTPNNKKGDK